MDTFSQRYDSIILLAASNANYRFTFIDVRSPDADGDVNVFSRTEFGKDNLDYAGDDMLCFFVADNAFSLTRRMMKSYGTANKLTSDQRIFNYRLSRDRRNSEY
nr:uncharacterized protein LOC115263660 [Aedes albopictus]